MERLIKIGEVKKKSSLEVKNSRIGLGFEKLDRAVFDPEKAYDKVAALGVKWIRLQSGWQRTEREKGVYKFEWLDDIVDNLIRRGLKPWMCVCYGNDLYTEEAKVVYGATGCPPIKTEEEKQAWSNYVTALVAHYKGKIEHFEVWNEPDGVWCWKHGVNPTEYGQFTIDTAKAIKKGNPDAKVIGGVMCGGNLSYMYDALNTGMGDYIDYFSFHMYTHDEREAFRRVYNFRGMCNQFNPKIKLIQGESGSQSRSDGHGALRRGGWNPSIQAKQLARHTMADLITEVEFTSYFSAMDMIEALRGTVGDKASYLDYGYFGVLSAEFDEDGFSTGEYTPKPSYKALQTISSVFAEDFTVEPVPISFFAMESERVFGTDVKENVVYSGFRRPNGSFALVYWYASNIMTTDFESTLSFDVAHFGKEIKIIDLMDGNIYKVPDSMIKQKSGTTLLLNMPIKDTPLLITVGDF